jgi:hypothetical protein
MTQIYSDKEINSVKEMIRMVKDYSEAAKKLPETETSKTMTIREYITHNEFMRSVSVIAFLML